MIFYDFLKFQQFDLNLCESFLQLDPCIKFYSHTYAFGSHKTPKKEFKPCNVVLGGGPVVGWPNSGEAQAEGDLGSPRLDLRAWLGQSCCRRGGSVELCGGRRKKLDSGEGSGVGGVLAR
jgi:hypothetical protein